MINILLIDVDSKIPNLALMKISSYYKSRGDLITLWRFGYSGYVNEPKKRRIVNAEKHDKVFVSCIFRCNKDVVTVDNCDEVSKGGSGYDIKRTLPKNIEASEPDYSIYPNNHYSYGFITRGCNRNCDFCIVPQKEGRLRFNNTVSNIVKHKKVRFLDNNILAYKHCEDILVELIEKKIRCSFYQGLDIRLVNERIANLLSQLNYDGEYTFAFDDVSIMKTLEEKIKILKKYITVDWRIRLFVYVNSDMDIQNSFLARINWCKANKIKPYIMRDENCFKGEKKGFYANITAWCNRPKFFKTMSFEQFLMARTTNLKTREDQRQTYFKGDL